MPVRYLRHQGTFGHEAKLTGVGAEGLLRRVDSTPDATALWRFATLRQGLKDDSFLPLNSIEELLHQGGTLSSVSLGCFLAPISANMPPNKAMSMNNATSAPPDAAPQMEKIIIRAPATLRFVTIAIAAKMMTKNEHINPPSPAPRRVDA